MKENVKRPDGRTWRTGNRGRSTYLVTGPGGASVLVSRTHDVDRAWDMAERRWRSEHGAAAARPAGRLTWARMGGSNIHDRDDSGLTEVEGVEAASFPAVVFGPPAAASAS